MVWYTFLQCMWSVHYSFHAYEVWQGQLAIWSREQKAEAVGESHYCLSAQAGKQAPPPWLNCCSAEAWHGFKCGNLRGRGGTCSGWSEGAQPGVMGLEPTNKKISTNREENISSSEKAVPSPQGTAGRLPAWVIRKQIFTKYFRELPGEWSGHDEEETSRPNGSFPVPTPMIPKSFCFFPTHHSQFGLSRTARILWSVCSRTWI